MEVLGMPNGVCAVGDRRGIPHGPKMSVNGEPVCLKCKSDAERARRTTMLVNTAKDPGHDGMKRIVPDGEATIVEVKVGEPAQHVPVHLAPSVMQAPATNGNERLQIIRAAIHGLPMPKSMAQYKRFLKIQQLIDQCISEEENG